MNHQVLERRVPAVNLWSFGCNFWLCCFRDNFIDLDIYMQELGFDEIEHYVGYDLNSFWSKFLDEWKLFFVIDHKARRHR